MTCPDNILTEPEGCETCGMDFALDRFGRCSRCAKAERDVANADFYKDE